MAFLQSFPDFRANKLSDAQLRFVVLVQHFVAQDAMDFRRPEAERQHDDTFEGCLTKGVNSQLVKDAHRAEWAIDGQSFLLPESNGATMQERKQVIASFQRELVTVLERYILAFCARRCLSNEGTQHLLQTVTTQMSQCGIANLDRCSSMGKYIVGGKDLIQRVNYNISSMTTGSSGEGLKLTLLCMKTGFQHYQLPLSMQNDPNEEDWSPLCCSPSSYLYEYATICFTTVPGIESADGCDRINCFVIDAMDEVRITEA